MKIPPKVCRKKKFLKRYKSEDLDWKSGRVLGYIYDPGQEVHDAITENTILLVGSAPGYAHGVVDPIRQIAALALEKKLLCHVDACVGGIHLS